MLRQIIRIGEEYLDIFPGDPAVGPAHAEGLKGGFFEGKREGKGEVRGDVPVVFDLGIGKYHLPEPPALCFNGKMLLKPVELFDIDAAPDDSAHNGRLVEFQDLVPVPDHQELRFDQLPDRVHRVLQHILAHGLQLDVKVIFLFEYLDQLQEHEGISFEIGNDICIVIYLMDINLALFCKKLINNIFYIFPDRICNFSH